MKSLIIPTLIAALCSGAYAGSQSSDTEPAAGTRSRNAAQTASADQEVLNYFFSTAPEQYTAEKIAQVKELAQKTNNITARVVAAEIMMRSIKDEKMAKEVQPKIEEVIKAGLQANDPYAHYLLGITNLMVYLHLRAELDANTSLSKGDKEKELKNLEEVLTVVRASLDLASKAKISKATQLVDALKSLPAA
jgi:hypothetical protein